MNQRIRKIYVASSWRNPFQQQIVKTLREWGYDVYDFRNPHKGNNGFHWSEIDPQWKEWSALEFVKALRHPLAESAFRLDYEALEDADLVVLVLPSGRSSHVEAAHHAGYGLPVVVYMPVPCEPELMYKVFKPGITTNMMDFRKAIEESTREMWHPFWTN